MGRGEGRQGTKGELEAGIRGITVCGVQLVFLQKSDWFSVLKQNASHKQTNNSPKNASKFTDSAFASLSCFNGISFLAIQLSVAYKQRLTRNF